MIYTINAHNEQPWMDSYNVDMEIFFIKLQQKLYDISFQNNNVLK